MSRLEAWPLPGLPEVRPGDDLAALIATAAGGALRPGDVLVVAHKVVSKAEGALVALDGIVASERARELADGTDKDPRHVQVVLDESAELVRAERGVLIARTAHGLVCANAGVDASNAPAPDMLVLLPVDPDASAAQIRERFRELTGKTVGVLITDSFGRPWRQGTIDVALGAAGIEVLRDLRGTRDRVGYELHATMIAIGDEIASAAELVMGKTDGIPAVVVRGLEVAGTGSAHDLVIPEGRDLFR